MINILNTKKEFENMSGEILLFKDANFIIIGEEGVLEENLASDNYKNFTEIWNKMRAEIYNSKESFTFLNLVSNFNKEKIQDNYFNNEYKLEMNKRDISMMRSLENINIFVPADKIEADYLLKINSLKSILMPQNIKNDVNKNFSYFRISKNISPIIFDKNYFEREDGLKRYDGLPEMIYLSKNFTEKSGNYFDITLISCGPIISSVIEAAKELEKNNFKVNVLNMSTLNSADKNINQNIKNFLINFSKNHKNILTIEEHSKIGGLGSLLCEILSKEKVKVERLGIEDDLSPKNIISTVEAFVHLW